MFQSHYWLEEEGLNNRTSHQRIDNAFKREDIVDYPREIEARH